jgi:hypothetical protein
MPPRIPALTVRESRVVGAIQKRIERLKASQKTFDAETTRTAAQGSTSRPAAGVGSSRCD